MSVTPRFNNALWLGRSARRRWALLTLGFLAVAIWSIWPTPRLPYEALPASDGNPATVPMFNAWTIWWNADRLPHGLAGYWNAPIFHPEPGTFAFSEPQLATWLVAPIVWFTGSPIPAYQAYLVFSLVLNGVFAVRLLRALRVRWLVSAAGGVAVLLLPLVHHNRDILQLMPLWGVLWTIEMLIKHHRRPTWQRGTLLGVAFASVFSTCIHHGVFLALLLGLTAWITIPLRHWKPWLAGVALAAATSGLLLLPLLTPMWQILKQQRFSRSASMVQSLSATASDWLQVSPTAAVRLPSVEDSSSRPLSPGWFRTALAGVGVLLAMRRGRHRRAVAFLAVLGCAAMILSFGLNLRIGAWQPWLSLADWAPGFSLIRSVYRFAYFTQLALILLAATGLDSAVRILPSRLKAGRARWLIWGALAVSCVFVAFEVPPAPVRLAGVPDVRVDRPWVAFLRQHTSAGRSVVCLPFAEGYSTAGSEQTGRWMLHATQHGVPLVNGYSGFFPTSWFQLVEALSGDPFGESTLATLAAAGVEYVVIEPQLMQGIRPPARSGRFQLAQVLRDESGVEIWRLGTWEK